MSYRRPLSAEGSVPSLSPDDTIEAVARFHPMETRSKPLVVLALIVILCGCYDEKSSSAVEDFAVVAVDTVAKIDVRANDLQALPDGEVRLLSAPLVGRAWIEDSVIHYAAGATPGDDLFAYEFEAHNQRSAALVQISILPEGDPALDSTHGVRVLQQTVPAPRLDSRPYVPVDEARADIQALVPLATEILAAYGNPRSNLDRARAIRDWVARTAIHPYYVLHPDGSTANLAVLPTWASWTDVNRLDYREKNDSDNRYWSEVHFNGYAMLDRLLGTVDPVTGMRADDGLMERVGPAHYRVRDLASYRYVQCTYQDVIAISLWGAIGLQGMLLSTVGHDPAAVYIPELGKWVYEDPTYNEEFTLEGEQDIRSPLELLALSLAGMQDTLTPGKQSGPSWSPDIYIDARNDSRATYFGDGHPSGMSRMGSQLNNAYAGTPGFMLHLVQIRVPDLEWPFSDESLYTPVDPAMAFPDLGARVSSITEDRSLIRVDLESTHPNHEFFERQINAGAWEAVSPSDVLDRELLDLAGIRVRYRSLSRQGTPGKAVGVLSALAGTTR